MAGVSADKRVNDVIADLTKKYDSLFLTTKKAYDTWHTSLRRGSTTAESNEKVYKELLARREQLKSDLERAKRGLIDEATVVPNSLNLETASSSSILACVHQLNAQKSSLLEPLKAARMREAEEREMKSDFKRIKQEEDDELKTLRKLSLNLQDRVNDLESQLKACRAEKQELCLLADGLAIENTNLRLSAMESKLNVPQTINSSEPVGGSLNQESDDESSSDCEMCSDVESD
jgi:chromosome segregation ATPase